MNTKRLLVCGISLMSMVLTSYAQGDYTHHASANDYLQANKRTDVTIVFNTDEPGIKTPVI